MVETVQQAVQAIEEAFWRRYETKPDLRDALKGKDRTIQIEITDDATHLIRVEDGRITGVTRDAVRKPDVRIQASRDDFLAVLNGGLNPIKAYFSGRVKVKAPMRDLLLVKRFLG